MFSLPSSRPPLTCLAVHLQMPLTVILPCRPAQGGNRGEAGWRGRHVGLRRLRRGAALQAPDVSLEVGPCPASAAQAPCQKCGSKDGASEKHRGDEASSVRVVIAFRWNWPAAWVCPVPIT